MNDINIVFQFTQIPLRSPMGAYFSIIFTLAGQALLEVHVACMYMYINYCTDCLPACFRLYLVWSYEIQLAHVQLLSIQIYITKSNNGSKHVSLRPICIQIHMTKHS